MKKVSLDETKKVCTDNLEHWKPRTYTCEFPKDKNDNIDQDAAVWCINETKTLKRECYKYNEQFYRCDVHSIDAKGAPIYIAFRAFVREPGEEFPPSLTPYTKEEMIIRKGGKLPTKKGAGDEADSETLEL